MTGRKRASNVPGSIVDPLQLQLESMLQKMLLKPGLDAQAQWVQRLLQPSQKLLAKFAVPGVGPIRAEGGQKKVSTHRPVLNQKLVAVEAEEAAQGLFQFDVIHGLPSLLRKAEDWPMLEKMATSEKNKDLDRWLRKRTGEQIQYVKSRLGIGRGRPRKPVKEKRDYQLALMVQSAIPKFQEGMDLKKQFKWKKRNAWEALQEELKKRHYDQNAIYCILTYTSPTPAACAWISETAEPKVSTETVQNAYRKVRHLFS